MEQINIVELIENNPITKLSNDYNVKLLTKIKTNFTNFEQQLFLSSFYCYLNYDQKNDFVIDLDDVWKWLGFSVKIKAKVLLEKYFVEEKDYKKSLYDSAQQSTHTKGGQNSDAAKDVKVSSPALRRRILTDVHINNYHWIFNKDACHYN